MTREWDKPPLSMPKVDRICRLTNVSSIFFVCLLAQRFVICVQRTIWNCLLLVCKFKLTKHWKQWNKQKKCIFFLVNEQRRRKNRQMNTNKLCWSSKTNEYSARARAHKIRIKYISHWSLFHQNSICSEMVTRIIERSKRQFRSRIECATKRTPKSTALKWKKIITEGKK